MSRRIYIAALTLLLSGCVTSTTAPSFSQAPKPQQRQDVAVLYIIRESAVPYQFTGYMDIDGKPAVQLQQQGFTWVYVKPGSHQLKHYWPLLASMPKVEFSRDFVAGQTYALEMRGQATFGYMSTELHPIQFADAQKQMEACCRFTPPVDGQSDF